MEYDLLFTIVDDENWKEITSEGVFAPTSLEELGYIKCIGENNLEQYVNLERFKGKQLILVVIDPLRVKDSIKTAKEDDFKIIQLYGTLTMDAIIDKIHLEQSKKGEYKISVKHYD